MDYFEQKASEKIEKEEFEKAYKKQMRMVKIILVLIFSILGTIFTVVGTCLLLFATKVPDAKEAGFVFTPIGAVFIIAVIMISIFMRVNNVEGSYERYKKRVNKYGYMNIYDMNAKIQILERRIEELERRLK